MCLPPVIQAEGGPIEKSLLFEAGLISEERYLKGTGYSNLVNLRRGTSRVFIRQVTRADLPAFEKNGREKGPETGNALAPRRLRELLCFYCRSNETCRGEGRVKTLSRPHHVSIKESVKK
jgi:hypothetical protein